VGPRPGAERIDLAESLDEALALKARHADGVALKDGPPAPGFDTVNSPGLLRSPDLGGRTVVQKRLDRFPCAMVAALEGSLMIVRPCAVPSPADGLSI
jgi:hypothetical protein